MTFKKYIVYLDQINLFFYKLLSKWVFWKFSCTWIQNEVYNLGNLKGKKACFSEVCTQAEWNIPVNTVKLTII